MCFVWIWEQTAIISMYSIDWLVFITETECVYCAVRTKFNILIFNWQCHGSGGRSPASYQEDQVSVPGQSRWNFGRQSGTEEFFFFSVEEQAFISALGPTQPPIRSATKVLSLGLKRLVRKADHLHECSVDVKNAWSYACASPMCLQLYLYHSLVVTYYSVALQDSLRTPVL